VISTVVLRCTRPARVDQRDAAGHPSQPAAYTPSTMNTSDFVDRNRIALRGATIAATLDARRIAIINTLRQRSPRPWAPSP